jgi:hypothetical protein
MQRPGEKCGLAAKSTALAISHCYKNTTDRSDFEDYSDAQQKHNIHTRKESETTTETAP